MKLRLNKKKNHSVWIMLLVVTTITTAQGVVVLPDPSNYTVWNVGETSAMVRGGVVDDGGMPCDCRFVYWKEGGAFQYTPWKSGRVTDDICGARLEGLDRGTVYYASLELRNDAGSVVELDRSWPLSFATPARVVIRSNPEGLVVLPGTGEFIYEYGAVVPLEAQTGTDWFLTRWTGTAVDAGLIVDPNAATTTYIAQGDTTLQANLLAQYTVSSTAGGSVTKPGEGTFKTKNGNYVTLLAKPNPGNLFTGWTGSAVDAGLVSNPASAITTMKVAPGKGVTANFLASYTVSSTAGGSVTRPGEGSFQAREGNTISLLAKTDEGRVFAGWTGSAVDAGLVSNPNSRFTTMKVMGGVEVIAFFIYP